MKVEKRKEKIKGFFLIYQIRVLGETTLIISGESTNILALAQRNPNIWSRAKNVTL